MARCLAVCLPALLMPALATAQLTDPTRPPVQLSTPVAEVEATGQVTSIGLQSVILKKEGRPAALINGELIELGGRVGEMKLVKVEEDSVILLGPEGRETLRLTPAAEKKQKIEQTSTKPIGLNAVKGEKRK